MISVIITAYNEPKTIGKAIYAFLNSSVENFEVICISPDEETAKVVNQYSKLDSRVKYLKDPGAGKMFALHLAFEKAKGDIFVLTDGDVVCDSDAFVRILEPFVNPNVGCVAGMPVSANSKREIFGFWSHLLTFAAHKKRLSCARNGKYFTCSGYLFAFRNNVIESFPRDVPEDAYIPYKFLNEGYKLAYAPKAKIYVKYPLNFNEWVEQKRRIAKAYENYKNLGDLPMMKSFTNEILEGPLIALSFPGSLKEFYWTLLLFPARLYMWMLTFWDTRVAGNGHADGWKRIESTK
ncbi:MAG: glycosyltransferase family 2 protein [archaeon]